MSKWLVPFLACLGGLSAGAWAKDVYVCEQNGVKTFSEQPCGAKAEVVRNLGDRAVTFRAGMPTADVVYFCKVALRGWDKSAAEANGRAYRDYYRGSSSSRENVRNYIMSHVANLESLAREEPALYRMVKELASTYSVNNEDSSDYDASRESARASCRQRIEDTLQSLADRNYRYENKSLEQLNERERMIRRKQEEQARAAAARQ